MAIETEILRKFGGVNENSLCKLMNDPDNDEDEINSVNAIKHSAFYDNELLSTVLKDKQNCFTIYSSNLDSIFSKFDELEQFIDDLKIKDIAPNVLCFQECYVNENTDLNLIQLQEYTCIVKGKTCGRKGGLVMYISDKLNFKNLEFGPISDWWEAQFIEIDGEDLASPLLIANIYRPP